MAPFSALLALVAACGAPPAVDGTTPGTEEAQPDGLMLVDVRSLPVRWVAAPGWAIGYPSVLGDVTGDGEPDAAVTAWEPSPTGQGLLLVVEGPLRRPLTLPGDEVASLSGAGKPMAGEATGDGVQDLWVVTWPDGDPYLVEGPLVGAIDPLAAGALVDRELADIDGDGILDLYSSDGLQGVRVTWGPASRWSGAPDLVVEAGSCPGDQWGFSNVHHLEAYPDLDGDGRREVWFEDDEHVCTSWLFPVPDDGMYDPNTDPAARYGIRELDRVGDQTGDGLPDVWTWWDRRVLAGPVTFGLDGQVSSAQVLQADPELFALYPTPYDLDQDGLVDFLALDAEIDESEVLTSVGGPIDPVSGEVLVVVPGGPALEHPAYGTAWDLAGGVFQEDDVFLEDGVVSVLVHTGDEIVVVDLGPGTAP